MLQLEFIEQGELGQTETVHDGWTREPQTIVYKQHGRAVLQNAQGTFSMFNSVGAEVACQIGGTLEGFLAKMRPPNMMPIYNEGVLNVTES